MNNKVKVIVSSMLSFLVMLTSISASATTDKLNKEFIKNNSEYQKQIKKANKKAEKLIIYEAKKDGVSATGKKQKKEIGGYPKAYGQILETNQAIKGLILTGHSGMVAPRKDDKSRKGYWMYESNEKGVQHMRKDWKYAYITRHKKKKYRGNVYGVKVKSFNKNKKKKAAAEKDGREKARKWAHKQIGKHYNWNYYNMGTRKTFYCSQLIWAAYKDTTKINLNTNSWDKKIKKKWYRAIHPMELVNTKRTDLMYHHLK